MSGKVWLNGRIVEGDEAVVSALGRGWTIGYGVFETLVAYGERPFALTRHYRRMQQSAAALDLPVPELAELREACREVLAANTFDTARARVRITVSEGAAKPEVTVTAVALEDAAPAVAVALSPYRRNTTSPLTGVKSTSYAENALAMAEARRRGAEEALLVNTSGQLCEGTSTNLFLIRHGNMLTPPLAGGCLAGVTRELVIELAGTLGLLCAEADMAPDSLTEADEAFLTSTTREVQPIQSVDGAPLASAPGEVTRRLQEAFRKLRDTEVDP